MVPNSEGQNEGVIPSAQSTLAKAQGIELLHEYNHAQWQPQYTDQVIRQAAELELLFLGSATLPESFDGLLPEAFRSLLAGQAETDLKQLVRDLLTNQSFRRDVYAKGRDPLWNLHASEAIQRLEVISLIETEDLLQPDAFSFRLPFGEVQGNRVWFLGLMEHLQQGPCRLGDLHRVPLHRDSAAGAPYAAIALPRTGNLMALSDLELMLLHAWQRGCRGDALIEALSSNLQSLGRSIQKEGQPMEGSERQELLKAHGSRFEARTLPLLQRLEAVTLGD